MRLLLICLTLAGGTVFAVWIDRLSADPSDGQPAPPHAQTPVPAGNLAAAPTLDDLAGGKLPIVDLGWPLNAKSAYWPGENYRPFELHTIATLEKDGVLSKAFSTPEHLGTHLDAPNHFERGRPSVDQIPPQDLFAPGVVIDVTGPVERRQRLPDLARRRAAVRDRARPDSRSCRRAGPHRLEQVLEQSDSLSKP